MPALASTRAECRRELAWASGPLTLNVRIPYWATKGGTVKLNGSALPVFSSPSSYLTLHRTWRNGDRVELSLPTTFSPLAPPQLRPCRSGPACRVFLCVRASKAFNFSCLRVT
ncbi:MAG: hypothetical protein ACRD2B_01470 [Terriglobia bacterium]